jgi:hypothetical protein
MSGPPVSENELRVTSPEEWPIVGVTMDEFRASYKVKQKQTARMLRELKAAKRLNEVELESMVIMWPSVDMTRADGWTDDKIETALEKYYVGAQ